MDDNRVGLAGARLSYGDGSFQHSAFHFPGLRQLWVEFFPTPGRLYESAFNGRYPRSLFNGQTPFAVDCVLGATMMLKREVIEQTGMFDEQFFMYCEEIDWAWRIRQAGWEIQCVPTAHVTHFGGQSAGQVRPRSVVDLWRSRLRLYFKHYPAWKLMVARQMVIQGMSHKIAQTQKSDLSIADKNALIEAYRTVQNLASGSKTE
jgi:N-acetylglucosaminyl-diphospho-decaprenol L-rhamnosyltransferase